MQFKSVSHLMQRYPNGIAQTITNGNVPECSPISETPGPGDSEADVGLDEYLLQKLEDPDQVLLVG